MAAVYSGTSGTWYTTGRKIGEGGEGVIYEVQGSIDLVVKVYKDPIDRDKEEKLRHMVAIARPELLKFAAWPVDVIRDSNGRTTGFAMRKLTGFVPLHLLFSPMDRKKLFADKGYNFLVHVARNLAAAFHQVHQLGIVAGDVNEANILVSKTGMIALIDCDSFQVKNGNRYHFCEVGIPRYTPPELLEKGSFEQAVRTINTDSFSLATLIFQLLFLGRAPFTGVNTSKDDLEEDKAIRLGEFAYSLRRSNKKLTPAKFSLALNVFTPGIVNSFHLAFENRINRPTPKQWIADLDELGKELVHCPRSGLHYYPKGMRDCPWCAFKDNAGIVYFFDDTYLKILPELNNIEQFVNGFRVEKITINKLSDSTTSASLKPAVISQKFKKGYHINLAFYLITCILSIALSFALSFWPILAGVILIILFGKYAPSNKTLRAELGQHKKNYDRLNANFKILVNKHNEPAELKRYSQHTATLSGLIVKFRRLPDDLIARKKMIEERYYNIQYHQHLQQFGVAQHPITSFGPAKKELIHKHGIKTAADIFKLKNTRIPGIGPKNIQVLYDWQRRMGSGFAYLPDTMAIDREISAAANEIFVEKLQLQNNIKQEYQKTIALRDTIKANTERLEKQYWVTRNKATQAELDYQAFRKLIWVNL